MIGRLKAGKMIKLTEIGRALTHRKQAIYYLHITCTFKIVFALRATLSALNLSKAKENWHLKVNNYSTVVEEVSDCQAMDECCTEKCNYMYILQHFGPSWGYSVSG